MYLYIYNIGTLITDTRSCTENIKKRITISWNSHDNITIRTKMGLVYVNTLVMSSGVAENSEDFWFI